MARYESAFSRMDGNRNNAQVIPWAVPIGREVEPALFYEEGAVATIFSWPLLMLIDAGCMGLRGLLNCWPLLG